ncbi:MAG: MipA/OmpV family protein [Acidobacteria bacterium]|nr:MipA/OmpV family protein [Acidobacteriota bacterium]
MPTRILALVAGLLAALPAPGQAPLWLERPEPGRWSFRAGGMVLATPAFPGSGQDRVLPLPVFAAVYDDRLVLGSSLVAVGAGAGLRLAGTPAFAWEVGLGLGERRPEARAEELAGLGDRQGELFIGTGFRARGGPFHASASVAAGLVSGAGAKATVLGGFGGRIAERMTAGLSLSAVWANAQNMAWDFGVSPEQAARRAKLMASGDPRLRPGEERAFAPGPGLKETALTAQAALHLDRRWQLFWVLRATALQGDARQGPLVRRDRWASGGMGFTARF